MLISQFLVDWLKIPFLRELKVYVKSLFNDRELSISDSILSLLSCFEHILSSFFTSSHLSFLKQISMYCEALCKPQVYNKQT